MKAEGSEAENAGPGDSRVLRLLLAANALLGVLVFVVFVADVGYDLPSEAGVATHALVKIVLLAVIAFEVVQIFRLGPRSFWQERKLELVVALFAAADLAYGQRLYAALTGGGSANAGAVALAAMLGRQLIVISVLSINLLRLSRRFARRQIPPGWIIILSFAALIALGTILLKLPRASAGGELSWLDCLFTATSAVTVTGLTVVDTGTGLSSLGQTIVLVLLQIGGIGVMTLTYFVAVVLRQDLTQRDRLMMREIVSQQRLSEGSRAVVRIVLFTLFIETIGVALLAASMWDLPDRGHTIYSALFHGVSAFCNAGFSIYDASLADPAVVDRAGFQVTMMALIVLGGLGFPVLETVAVWLWKGGPGLRTSEGAYSLPVHAKIAFTTTVVLLVGGALAIYFTEYLWHGGAPAISSWMSASFLSVTARTAGFNTVDTGALGPTTVMLLVLLMAIGGSPAGTAGGIRTTTVAVASMNLRRVLLDRDHLRAFGVRIPDELAGRALAIISLSVLWIGVATGILTLLHPELAVLDLNFEVVSAFATVGLSRGVTAELCPTGKAVLIVTMFAGRVGILTFINAFVSTAPRTREEDPPVEILL